MSLLLYYIINVIHRLLLSWAMHFASPIESGGGSSDNCSSIHCVICRSIESLNEIQVDMCTDVPQSLTVLTNAQPIIAGECKWQFRKDQWDCAGITTPIIEEPNLKCKCKKESIGYWSIVYMHLSCKSLVHADN